MAQEPKPLEGAQKPHNIDIVSVSSDELEIVGTGTRSAYNADSQANDWLSAEAAPQVLVSAGQGPLEGLFPVESVFHPEHQQGRLDKDGGSARPPLPPVNISRTLVKEFDIAASDTPQGTPRETAAQPTRSREGTLGRRDQTPGRASKSIFVPGTPQGPISIHSSPQTIHSSPQSDIHLMQQVVLRGSPCVTAAQPTRSPGGPSQANHTSGDGSADPSQPPLDSGFGASLEDVMDTVPLQDIQHEGTAAQPSRPREELMTSDVSFDSQAAAAAQPAGPTASTSFDFQTQPLTAQPLAAVPTLQSLSTAQPS